MTQRLLAYFGGLAVMNNLTSLSIFVGFVLLATACATPTTNLVVNVDPLDVSGVETPNQLPIVVVEDARTRETGESTRLYMGIVSFEPTETALVKRELETQLQVLLEQSGFQSPQFYHCEILEFKVDTEGKAFYWDVIGSIHLRLQLSEKSLDLSGTHTERTYVWPGEEIIESVVQESLSQINDQLRSNLEGMPVSQLAGLPEQPSEWPDQQAIEAGLKELALPAYIHFLNEQALIYLFWPSRIGSGNIYKISINDDHVANIRNGSRFPFVVEPGKARIHAQTKANLFNIGLPLLLMDKPDLDVELGPGEVYFIEIKVGLSGGPELIPVNRTAGIKGIKKTKLIGSVKE